MNKKEKNSNQTPTFHAPPVTPPHLPPPHSTPLPPILYSTVQFMPHSWLNLSITMPVEPATSKNPVATLNSPRVFLHHSLLPPSINPPPPCGTPTLTPFRYSALSTFHTNSTLPNKTKFPPCLRHPPSPKTSLSSPIRRQPSPISLPSAHQVQSPTKPPHHMDCTLPAPPSSLRFPCTTYSTRSNSPPTPSISPYPTRTIRPHSHDAPSAS
eukprot:GFKZ01005240.1.p1 GENE.GFKZ01005240.1~~GFKZ01005240.1.p1  ORF type:complete len:211 (+),score=11.34 GFKZ01005240.1:605-1237(+)